MRYRDRVAVVTGAGSGIGRALTIALSDEGAHVAASDIDEVGLDATKAMCRAGGITTYRVDVADREAFYTHAAEVRSDLGPASMVFNNAGVDLLAKFVDMSWTDFDWLMGINLGGVMHGSKAFLPQLLASGTADRPARLVNMSSAFGLIPIPSQTAYCASKFAVRGFTEALRQEMIVAHHAVTVHCIHPGVVRTNFAANARTLATDPKPILTKSLFDRVALTTPEKAAQIILRGVDRNRARILVGADGWAAAAMPRLLGRHSATVVAYGARLANRLLGRSAL